MKTCIPVSEDKGLRSRINEHFGKAPYHAIVDLDTRTAGIVDKKTACGDQCAPIELMVAKDVKQVMCKKIGQGAVNRFRQSGIEVKRTTAFTIQEALIEQSLRFLPEVTEKDLCHGHDHHDGCAGHQ